MSTKIRYFSKGNETDGASYCSGVETLAENLIEDNEDDATIVFPSKNGWISPRNEDELRITTENAQIVLPYPIYKIVKIQVALAPYITFSPTLYGGSGPAWYKENTNDGMWPFNTNILGSQCYDRLTGEKWDGAMDITEFVKPYEEYNALMKVEYKDVYDSINRNNTMYYKQGDNKICYGESSQKFFGGAEKSNIVVLLGKFIKDFNERAHKAENTDFDRKLYTFVKEQKIVGPDEGGTQIFSSDGTRIITDIDDFDSGELITNALFRIEYIPVSSKTKLRARKAASTTVDYIQPFNQRAELNAASAFGKNMYLTAQKTGVREIKLVKDYTLLSEIPPIGARIRHDGKVYRLVANHYSLTNTVFLRVTHTLSENWSAKSKHVSVDQKYRNWKIPQDILWRNLYWENYLHISFENIAQKREKGDIDTRRIVSVMKPFDSIDKPVTALCWHHLPNSWCGVTVPCSTYGMGNSLVFTASFKDNLSAGISYKDYKLGADNCDKEYCEEVLYCNEDGTLEEGTVVLTSGIGNFSPTSEGEPQTVDTEEAKQNAIVAYPSIYSYGTYSVNMPVDNIFKKEFYIYKDAGEALKFTYQIHFIPESSDIVIGQALAVENALVKAYGGNRNVCIILSKKPFREGEKYWDGEGDVQPFSVWAAEGNSKCANGNIDMWFGLNDTAKATLGLWKYKAWGFALYDDKSKKYALLIGCNAKEYTKLHFACSKEK